MTSAGAEANRWFELANGGELAAIYGEREEFYRTILDNLSEGVIITDGEDRILYVNARMKDLLGLKPTTLASKLARLDLKREAFIYG